MSGDPVIAELLALSPAARARKVRELPVYLQENLLGRWSGYAHPAQVAPPGDWHVWLIRAGRGFGKTRAGAEWISQVARDNPKARIALVGGTIEDARRVMIEGASGLTAVSHVGEDVIWMPHKDELLFASGARAYVYAATKRELRVRRARPLRRGSPVRQPRDVPRGAGDVGAVDRDPGGWRCLTRWTPSPCAGGSNGATGSRSG